MAVNQMWLMAGLTVGAWEDAVARDVLQPGVIVV